MNYQVTFRENLYFTIKLIVTAVVYAALAGMLLLMAAEGVMDGRVFITGAFYVGIFLLYLLFRHGILIGYLRGNAVRASADQFPALFDIANEQAEKLGLGKVPAVYVLQAGGLLNAFATRFFWKDFVVVYTDVLETAYEEGNKALEFIVGHELGHIARRHSTKHTLLFPSFIVPFLNSAYSRACEYTCDRIGHALCPEGSAQGMLVLAAGKRLHSKVNVNAFLSSSQSERGFWKWFAEIVSSHPNLPKRIAAFRELADNATHHVAWTQERIVENG